MAAIEFNLGSTLCMQQTVSGGGTFTGAHMGRASLDIGGGPTLTRFRARRYGVDANTITVEFIDAGVGVVVPATLASLVGSTNVKVMLRRNAGAVLATAAEVANAVNNYRNTSNPTQLLPVVCSAPGVGVVAAAAAAPLTGGIDPTVVTPQYKFALAGNGGLFYFDQTEPVEISQMECLFTAPGVDTPAYFKIANLDAGLEVITAETSVDFTATIKAAAPWAAFVNAPILILPRQAFIVECALTGVARVYARRVTRLL